MLRTMALLALMAAPAAAQSPAPKPGSPPSTAEKPFLGTWEGPYTSEQAAPGELRLVIARDTALKASLTVMSDQPIEVGETRELKIEDGAISWVQDVMGMVCRASAMIYAGTLKGETVCEQDGAVAVTASWVLVKK
jgi:uncharacterized protein YbbC (DUF1343 family)